MQLGFHDSAPRKVSNICQNKLLLTSNKNNILLLENNIMNLKKIVAEINVVRNWN